jgi:hypothetical protein
MRASRQRTDNREGSCAEESGNMAENSRGVHAMPRRNVRASTSPRPIEYHVGLGHRSSSAFPVLASQSCGDHALRELR